MLSRCDPLAKLLTGFALIAVATLTTNRVVLGGLLAAALAATLADGVRLRLLARGLIPFLFFAATSSWIYAVAPDPSHRAIAGSGWQVGLTVGLRILATGAVSTAFALTTDPAALTRALVARWGISRRFAYGALAAVQFMPALAEELRLAVMMARTGLPKPEGLRGRLRWRFAGWTPGTGLGLFAAAIRRAGAAALAMELRGLRATSPPGGWRAGRVTGRDALLAASSAALVAGLFALSRLT